jgi:regulatory protein
VGDVLTEEQLRMMLEWDDYPRLKNKFFELLARRPHSRLELRQKAIFRGYAPDVADEVISMLEESGYIDDSLFACILARNKFERSNWGPNRIRAALKGKGIDNKLIDQALEKTIKADQLSQQIRNLTRQKVSKLTNVTDSLKRRKKVYDFLIRKGYRHTDVMNVLKPENF